MMESNVGQKGAEDDMDVDMDLEMGEDLPTSKVQSFAATEAISSQPLPEKKSTLNEEKPKQTQKADKEFKAEHSRLSKERAHVQRQKEVKKKTKHIEHKNLLKKPTDFLPSRMPFLNTLPDLPFDLKLLANPTDSARYARYTPSTLETQFHHPILTPTDLGCPINVIDPNAYPSPSEALSPEDQALCQDLFSQTTDEKKELEALPWLRRTVYMSTENIKTVGRPNLPENRVGGLKSKADADLHSTEAQVKAIETTFTVAQQMLADPASLKHPTQPGLTAVSVQPFLPDEEIWSNVYTQVEFGDDPSQRGLAGPQGAGELARLRQGVLKGLKTESSSEPYLMLFLPKSDAADETAEVKAFEYVRPYTVQVKRDEPERFDSFLICRQEDKITYCDLRTRIQLKKKKARVRGGIDEDIPAPEAVIVDRFNVLTAAEDSVRRDRLSMLEQE